MLGFLTWGVMAARCLVKAGANILGEKQPARNTYLITQPLLIAWLCKQDLLFARESAVVQKQPTKILCKQKDVLWGTRTAANGHEGMALRAGAVIPAFPQRSSAATGC